MSKIKKFKFKNIRSYGNKMVEMPFDMDNGLVLISGENGGGKTSIVEALEFAIYGKSSRVPVKNLPNWINDNAFTSIEFDTDDGRTVELSRGISPDFYDLKVGGDSYSSKTKSENKAGKNKIDKMVEDELFGLSQDIFSNNVLLSVQDFKSFIKMKSADKRKIIDKIFDTDIFNDMLVKVKDEISDLKHTQTELKSYIEGKQGTLDATNARIEEIKSTISDDIDLVISRFQNKITELEGIISTKSIILSDKNSNIESLTSEYNGLMTEYNNKVYSAMVEYKKAVSIIEDEYNKSIQDYVSISNSKLSDELNSIESNRSVELDMIPSVNDTIDSKISEIRDKIEKVKTILKDFHTEENAKIKKETDYNAFVLNNELMNCNTEYNKVRSELIDNLNEYTNKLNELNLNLEEVNESIKNTYAKISIVKNKLSVYKNDKCPECGGDLHDSFHTKNKESLESEFNALSNEYSSLNSKKTELTEDITKYNSLIAECNVNISKAKESNDNNVNQITSKYKDLLNTKLSEINIEINSMDLNGKNKISQLENEIVQITEKSQLEYSSKTNEINSKYDSKVNSIRAQYTEAYNLFEKAQKNDLDSKKSELSENYNKAAKDNEDNYKESASKYASEIDIAKEDMKLLSDEIEALKNDLNSSRLNLVTVQNGDTTKTINELSSIANDLISDINKKTPELEECEKKIRIRENTQALIGENGLKRIIMRNILPQFNASIQRITSLFDFKYRFIFDDNFDAHLSWLGEEVPTTVSRGEEKIMDIIVILSTLQLILLKHPNINMLFLDEIFSNLDVKNIAKAVSILKDYSRKYNLIIFVVSHTTVPVELFDKTVNVSYDGSFSSIEIN